MDKGTEPIAVNSHHQKYLRIANEALDRARRTVVTRAPSHVTSKSDRDYVSDIDLMIEREVRALLGETTPEIAFLGEEEGWTDERAAERFWTLDPIDGTSNLVNHLPLCAVSIALVEGDQAVVGAIDLPFLDMRYTASVGCGAHNAGRKLQAVHAQKLDTAIVAIGDYAVGKGAELKNTARLSVTKDLAASVQRIRMLGSAAIDLAWVAEGRLDANVMLSNKPWDTAAGVLIAREAGCDVVDVEGRVHTVHSSTTVASTQPLLQSLTRLLVQATNEAP